MRRIQLVSHLTTDELEARYRRAHKPTERSWWQILWLLSRDQTAKVVAESTGFSRYWIGQIAKRYNAEGPAGMVNRQHTRARRTLLLLSSAQLEELHQALSGPAPEGERWTSRTVAAWMAVRLGRPVAPQRGWDYLQRFGARLRQPRPRHVAASPEEQAAFKKRSVG
ncbi:MAG: winged helix-turn-helix domain-containing protein [Ktedonobacterales bacterium]